MEGQGLWDYILAQASPIDVSDCGHKRASSNSAVGVGDFLVIADYSIHDGHAALMTGSPRRSYVQGERKMSERLIFPALELQKTAESLGLWVASPRSLKFGGLGTESVHLWPAMQNSHLLPRCQSPCWTAPQSWARPRACSKSKGIPAAAGTVRASRSTMLDTAWP